MTRTRWDALSEELSGEAPKSNQSATPVLSAGGQATYDRLEAEYAPAEAEQRTLELQLEACRRQQQTSIAYIVVNDAIVGSVFDVSINPDSTYDMAQPTVRGTFRAEWTARDIARTWNKVMLLHVVCNDTMLWFTIRATSVSRSGGSLFFQFTGTLVDDGRL